jgi:plasmid stabilization system protein ParE
VAWRIRWTGPAEENLDAAAAYIAEDSLRFAATLIREARDAARSLRYFANRGRVVPEINNPTVRELFVFRDTYRLIYQVFESEVRILAFIHGSRDLFRALREH